MSALAFDRHQLLDLRFDRSEHSCAASCGGTHPTWATSMGRAYKPAKVVLYEQSNGSACAPLPVRQTLGRIEPKVPRQVLYDAVTVGNLTTIEIDERTLFSLRPLQRLDNLVVKEVYFAACKIIYRNDRI